ncbi:MAG TPA: ComEC/Rec2 family competence protein [Clostridia bacterium]|nr:ComEC/Rec2 family competence protein [Clostridia bacterium]
MESGGRSKKSREEKLRRTRLIVTVVIVAALAIYYLVDPVGFRAAMTGLFGEEPTASASPAGALPSVTDAAHPGDALEVYFLDVGQGDCIFLRSPGGKTMLVDAGESQYFDVIDAFLKSRNVTKLDAVVETHPHSDHMGAMVEVIEHYEIGVFYASPATNNTVAFEKMLDALEKKNVETVALYADETPTLDWDEDVTVRVLSPFTGESLEKNLNDASIVLNIAYKNTSVLLTGDAETSAEEVMLERFPAEYFKATVLKLGHHGSSSSTGADFFAAVSPEAVAISLGKDNDYGHPHKEILEMLKQWGGPVYRTDLNGTIHFTLDGEGYTVDTKK